MFISSFSGLNFATGLMTLRTQKLNSVERDLAEAYSDEWPRYLAGGQLSRSSLGVDKWADAAWCCEGKRRSEASKGKLLQIKGACDMSPAPLLAFDTGAQPRSHLPCYVTIIKLCLERLLWSYNFHNDRKAKNLFERKPIFEKLKLKS